MTGGLRVKKPDTHSPAIARVAYWPDLSYTIRDKIQFRKTEI